VRGQARAVRENGEIVMRQYGALKIQRAAVGHSFGPLMRRLREALNLQTREIGEVLGYDSRDIHRFEVSDRLPPRRDVVCKLARYLRGDPIDLLAAAAHDSGAVEVDGLTLEQVREIVAFAERVRAGASAPAKGVAS
jgi:hypothetical protein